MLLEEGQNIRDTYEVERLLGEGAFGEVYRVKHRFFGRQAMKVFKVSGMTPEETEKNLEEAILLSRLGHPNVIKVFEANTVGTPIGMCGFFTMEYVAGGSLDQFWKSHGAQFVPIETSVEIVLQVARGLAVAHREKPPIVHRDIKPQNILVGYDGSGLRARLSDFGLAKHVNPLTLMASARGTPAFKAPEAYLDVEGDSCPGDIWALGTTLYLLLTDRLPYPDVDALRAGNLDQLETALLPASRLNSQVDPDLERILKRCLAMRKKERYPTAVELMKDLEGWQSRAGTSFAGKEQVLGSSTMAKSVVGKSVSINQKKAQEMIDRALKLAADISRLKEAADLMEEAFNHWPELRHQYEYKLKLWRRGLVM